MQARLWLMATSLLLLSGFLVEGHAAPKRKATMRMAAQEEALAGIAATPSAVLAWGDYGAGAPYDGFVVKRREPGGTFAEVGRVAKGNTTFTDISIVSLKLYCYVVSGYLGTVELSSTPEACGSSYPGLTGFVVIFR